MKIRLTHDEVIQACAEYASKNTAYTTLEKSIIESQMFIITDVDGNSVVYETVEFEYTK